MQLLVSVTNASEAAAALEGGADLIDAKDPRSGALGAVTPQVLRAIHAAVGGSRPVTAALGDASDEAAIEEAAQAFTLAGARLVKIGFAGTSDAGRVSSLIAAAVRGAGDRGAVVAVAYADDERAGSLAPEALVAVAARAGATGVLLDTADKDGPGLRERMPVHALASWVASAHAAGLQVALAGKLTAADLSFVREAGADIAGVRGAACDGGRLGCVSAGLVCRLRAMLNDGSVRLQPDLGRGYREKEIV